MKNVKFGSIVQIGGKRSRSHYYGNIVGLKAKIVGRNNITENIKVRLLAGQTTKDGRLSVASEHWMIHPMDILPLEIANNQDGAILLAKEESI